VVDPASSVASGDVQAYARDRLTVTLNGKYVLERRLGGGGMAEVFLARTVGAQGFSRPVAIKRVLDGLSRDPRFAEMFIAEARLSSRLQHPNLVSVIDFDQDADGRLFLVMELVDGVDLRGLMDTGSLPFSVVIHLVIETLRGLDYAHNLPLNPDGVRGLVHRDISPHNVLLSWEGAVKVSDFGIAKAREATNATASLMMKGKPAYMSPEQVNGRPLDGRSDLFAVGVMMFEMLCARHPFSGGTPEEIYGQVLYQDIPPVRQMRPDIPEDLASVVASLLVRDRDRRMPSAEAAIAGLVACESCPRAGREELIELLSRHFAGRAPVRARNVSHASHSDPTLVARPVHVLASSVKTSTSDLGASSRADRRWLWAVLAAFLVIGGAVGVLVAGGRGAQPAASSKPVAADPPPVDPPKPSPTEPLASPPAPAATAPTGSAPAGSATEVKGEQDATAPLQSSEPAAPARDRSRAPTRRESPSKSTGIREIRL
jgi:eukaryotic-like serine/threonine-protein kinase